MDDDSVGESARVSQDQLDAAIAALRRLGFQAALEARKRFDDDAELATLQVRVVIECIATLERVAGGRQVIDYDVSSDAERVILAEACATLAALRSGRPPYVQHALAGQNIVARPPRRSPPRGRRCPGAERRS